METKLVTVVFCAWKPGALDVKGLEDGRVVSVSRVTAKPTCTGPNCGSCAAALVVVERDVDWLPEG